MPYRELLAGTVIKTFAKIEIVWHRSIDDCLVLLASLSQRPIADCRGGIGQALIARYGTLGRVPTPFLLRSDHGLVLTSRSYTALVRSYGLRQEFITPHTPEQNSTIERMIRTLKDQCVHSQRFEALQHANRAIGNWISFHNNQRPHQALGMETPAEAFKLAA